MRGFAKNGEVRGITILYDQAMEGTMDPLVAPMSSAFVPFATGFAVAGTADAPRRKVEYGTGVFVSAAGHVLTDRQLIDGCNVIALPGLGNAERVATDDGGELALLRVYGARNLTPIGMIGGARRAATSVTLVGIADPQAQGGGAAISTVSAKLGAAATRARSKPRRRSDSPAPPRSTRRAASPAWWCSSRRWWPGPSSAPQAAVVPVERIRNFLEANYVAPSSGAPASRPRRRR